MRQDEPETVANGGGERRGGRPGGGDRGIGRAGGIDGGAGQRAEGEK